MKRWLVLTSFLAAAAFMSAPLAQANEAVIKERVGIMKNISGSLKALDKSAKSGKVGGNDAARAAKALAGAKKFATLFPKGSHAGPFKTRAKEAIWAEWAKFESQAGKLVGALEGVQKAAASGDAAAMGAAVKEARATCGGCHKPFRGPRMK